MCIKYYTNKNIKQLIIYTLYIRAVQLRIMGATVPLKDFLTPFRMFPVTIFKNTYKIHFQQSLKIKKF